MHDSDLQFSVFLQLLIYVRTKLKWQNKLILILHVVPSFSNFSYAMTFDKNASHNVGSSFSTVFPLWEPGSHSQMTNDMIPHRLPTLTQGSAAVWPHYSPDWREETWTQWTLSAANIELDFNSWTCSYCTWSMYCNYANRTFCLQAILNSVTMKTFLFWWKTEGETEREMESVVFFQNYCEFSTGLPIPLGKWKMIVQTIKINLIVYLSHCQLWVLLLPSPLQHRFVWHKLGPVWLFLLTYHTAVLFKNTQDPRTVYLQYHLSCT